MSSLNSHKFKYIFEKEEAHKLFIIDIKVSSWLKEVI